MAARAHAFLTDLFGQRDEERGGARPPVPRGGPSALVLADPSGTGEGSLRHARREGASVRRIIGGDSRLLCGAQASKAALKAASLRSFGIVHFATHAVADDASPDRSAVLLAKATGDDDGRLRPSEVAALDLRARAIVLSACRTAAGPVASGEGVLILVRAFFEGGALRSARLRACRAGRDLGGRRAAGRWGCRARAAPPVSWRLPLLLAGAAVAALGRWARARRRVDVP